MIQGTLIAFESNISLRSPRHEKETLELTLCECLNSSNRLALNLWIEQSFIVRKSIIAHSGGYNKRWAEKVLPGSKIHIFL